MAVDYIPDRQPTSVASSPKANDRVWLVLALLVIIFGPIIAWAVDPLVDAIYPQSSVTFIPWATQDNFVKPDGHDQVRYGLALGAAALLAISCLALPPSFTRRSAEPPNWSVLAIQIGLAGVGVICLFVSPARSFVDTGSLADAGDYYFGSASMIAALAVAASAVALARSRRVAHIAINLRPDTRRSAVCLVLAAAATVVWLLPAFFREENIAHALSTTSYHILYPFGDFLAIVNGRTPFVDYVPSYSSLVGYLVAAPFSLLGSSLGAFSGLMCLLSLLALLAVYCTFKLVTREPLFALALYLPFLGISVFPVIQQGNEYYSFATNYTTLPLRYFGPLVLVWLCARELRDPHPGWRRSVLFGVAGLAAINNIEFGLPSAVALATALWWGESNQRGLASRIPTLAAQAVAGIAGAWVLVSVLALIRSGSLPDPSLWVGNSSLYASGGYAMLPMPPLGFHVIIYLTFAAALTIAARGVRGLGPAGGDPVLRGALAFAAVFGFGVSAYYVGRSAPSVLPAIFPAWGLALGLLTWLTLSELAATRRTPLRSLATLVLPAAMVLFGFGLMASTVTKIPNPVRQLERIRADTGSQPLGQNNLARALGPRRWTAARTSFVRAHTEPDERVAILAPLGPRTAERAGVESVFPYANATVATVEEIDFALRTIRNSEANTAFVSIGDEVPPELPLFLRSCGYRRFAKGGGLVAFEWAAPRPDASVPIKPSVFEAAGLPPEQIRALFDGYAPPHECE